MNVSGGSENSQDDSPGRTARRGLLRRDRGTLGRWGLFLVVVLSPFAAVRAARPPNVLLVVSDDQGWGDVHRHGNPHLDSPVLDRLAQSGAQFDRFFVSPVCALTRASLLTGRQHLRGGVWGTTRGKENLRTDEITIAELLAQGGYATGCFGKWHNGAHFPHHPRGQGFQEFLGFCGGFWPDYFDPPLERNGEPIRTTGFITDVLTDAAMAFMSRHAERPFFCYVAYNVPHTPWQVPDRYFDKYRAQGLDDITACAYGMLENLDENLGRLVKQLDELQLARDTIVIFLSDNGPNSDRFNGDLRGRQGSLHEGGIRVPCFIRFPDQVRPGLVVRPIASHVDLFPTIAEFCRVPVPRTVLDGQSLVPLLRETADVWPERTVLTFLGKGDRGAVRTDRWRAVKDGKEWELYDMKADPAERHNVVEQHHDVVSKLATDFANAVDQMTQGGFDAIPIDLGHKGWPVVNLASHEGFLHLASKGGIRYSGASGETHEWITGWTDPEAYPWWEVNVVAAGVYEVSILYGCAKPDLGIRLKVEVGDAAIEAAVAQPHEAPALKSEDRVPRQEPPEREWGALAIGTIWLPPGRHRLAVRAIEIPGKQAVDLKAVRVRRIDPNQDQD